MEATSLADQISHGLQATSKAVPWAHYSQFWGRYYVLTTEPGPWLQSASQATTGAGEDLWSHFLSTLASFFTSLKIIYFHHNQFLFSPAVVVSPWTELWSTGVAATWTIPAAETDRTRPKLKGFFIQNKIAGRRNFKGKEAIPRTYSGYTGVHLIIILILHNSYMFFHEKVYNEKVWEMYVHIYYIEICRYNKSPTMSNGHKQKMAKTLMMKWKKKCKGE